MWFNTGVFPSSWDAIRKAAPALKQSGHPVGLGMSQELDSNMMLMSLLYCYGASLQNEENSASINSKATIEALKVMRDIFKRGMTDEVFAWTTASNNDAFLAGRFSLAVNAISIRRTAEDRRFTGRRHVARSHPAGAGASAGQRARDGHLLHLEVRQEQGSGEAVPRRPAARLQVSTS